MKKWVGKLFIILVLFFNVSCQKDRYKTIEYNKDFLVEYAEEIKLLFGEINVLSKERFTETYRSYTLIKTINYDVWSIEYTNVNQDVKYTQFYNRDDFISLMSGIIIEEITEEVLEVFDLEMILFINYENGPENLDKIEDIDPKFYPINLSFDNLPDDLLIVITPPEDRVKDFDNELLKNIDKINTAKIKNMLLLEGDDAYEMDHGVLIVNGIVIQEKISVADAIKLIKSVD